MSLVAWQDKVQRVCISHITEDEETSSAILGGTVRQKKQKSQNCKTTSLKELHQKPFSTDLC